MDGDPMLCAPCRVGDHRSHTDNGCSNDNNFNSDCECSVDLVWCGYCDSWTKHGTANCVLPIVN